METPKNAKDNTAETSSSEENSSEKSSESKEAREEASSGIEESKGKTKDASKNQTLFAEGFCGFDETDNSVQTRSTREASRNATAILTKKSPAKPEKTEGKSDSPPDLVLFLKEGRGRAQTYSEPPRLDPESIATRRRTRVPEDPVALISRVKSASAEKTKKDQKGFIKKERKTIVMDTPESLKRLAREGSRQVQTTSKESSDSGSEEKTLKKVYSKGTSEGDVKVKSTGTSTRPGEEQPASISKRNSRGKRNSSDELGAEVLGEDRATSPAIDSPDESMNYSNLGSILNKMSKNVADKRIPVVIMSKSEKEPKVDSAKPKSKKRAPPDRSSNTAVLKMASPTIPGFPADKSIDKDDAALSKPEGECKAHKQDEESCGSPSSRGISSDSEIDEDVIVLKVNSDVRSEEENITSNIKNRTGNSTLSESNSSSNEKVQVKQNIIISGNKEEGKTNSEPSKAPGRKEAVISGPCQSGSLKAAQVSASSLIKLTSASSSVRSGTIPVSIRSGLVITSVKPSPITPKPLTPPVKPSLIASHDKPSSVTPPISFSPLASQVKPSPSTSFIKPSSITSHVKPSAVTPSIRPSSVVSQVRPSSVTPSIKPSLVASQVKLCPGISSIKSNPVASHVKPSPSTSPIKPNPVMSQIKISPVTTPIKPGSLVSHVKPTPSTSQVKPSQIVSHAKPSPVTSRIKPSPVTSHHSHVSPRPSTSPIKSDPFVSQVMSSPCPSPVKSNLVVSQANPSTVPSPIKPSSVLSHVKPSTVASPIKSNLVMSQVKSSPVPSPLKSASVTSVKSSSVTSPIKSGSVTSSGLQGQNVSSCVVSTPKVVSFGSAKGSMKMTTLASNKVGAKVSSTTKATSTTQTPKREITTKQESSSTLTRVTPNTGRNKSQGSQVSAQETSNSLSQKGPMLDYTDIETEEVVLGENEDSSGQMDKVGDMPAGLDLLAHEELESSSEEDAVRIPDQTAVPKKESLSPEGRVALDHSYSSGGSGSSRKKSPTTYEKSLTPRPVYSNASPAKRSLDIMLHNDKINILRQMSQIFNDEKPPSKIFSDEKDTQPDTDNSVSSCSDGEDEAANTVIRKTEENIQTKSSSKTIKHVTEDPDKKNVNMKKITKTSTIIQEDGTPSEAMSSKPLAVEVSKPSGACGTSSEANSPSENTSYSREKSPEVQETPPLKERKGKNTLQVTGNVTMDSPFLGFPDPDPKVHHVPAYSLTLNEKISVQSTVSPAGEMIDIVDGFSFTSFSSEKEMMSYDGTYSGKTMKTHHQWLKKKQRRRNRLLRQKGGIQRVYPKVVHEEPTSSVAGSAASLRERGATAECGAFSSDDLDAFLVENSHLNISYQIPKCKVTGDGVSRIDKEEVLEPIPPLQTQTHPLSPHSPPGSPSSSHPKVIPSRTQTVTPVNPNTSAIEHTESESVPQYEEVNAIDILYPKEKYKYYYNKELCKETKADGSNVFVQRAGKLVPLTTVLKSQKSSLSEQPSSTINQSVELVYVYDGGKLLTLGGSLTKINPSNFDCVHARVVLPKGVPSIPKGETVAARAKKVHAVEINKDMAKFALSALQSSPLKSEQASNMKDDSEELPPLPGPSSVRGREEKMDMDSPPKAVPRPVPIKPTKINILDIISAKLAMSDDESDDKDDVEEKVAVDVKESEKAVDKDSNQTTKHVVTEGKEEGKPVTKEEDIDGNIDQGTIRISEESKIPLLKQEDLKEEKPIEEATVKPEVSAEKDVKLETEVEEDVTQETKDTQRSSAKREREEEDGDKPVIVKKTRNVFYLENSEKTDSESDVNSMEVENVGETVTLKEEQKGDGLRSMSNIIVGEIDSERNEEIVFDEKEEANPLPLEGKGNGNKVSVEKDKDQEHKSRDEEDNKVKSNAVNLKEDCNKNYVPVEMKNLQDTPEIGNNKEPAVLEEEDIINSKKPYVNLKGKEIGESKEADVENKENSALIAKETATERKTSAVADENTANPSSEICSEEVLANVCSCGNTSQAECVINEPISDSSGGTLSSTLLPSSQESRDKTDLEEKAGDSLESGSQEAFQMDVKLKVFKKNMYRFPSLSQEMKRLDMNFVNYEPPPQEAASVDKEEAVQEVKEDCNNEHCKLGCVCDSLLCQHKSVEHYGRVECMFECTCQDESWKPPSGSGRTVNAVSIFNLDREQKEGLALREKDFKRAVIQTGSEVILVGAERKKREIRLPGRYRGTTVWAPSEFPENINTYFETPELPLQPDYPGILLSEASKYIKNFTLNIPWFDIKGISIWCMYHSCYDCKCLTDSTFDDPIQVEFPKKITSPGAKSESSSLQCGKSFTSTLSALVDFGEALKQKTSDVSSSSNDVELKIPFVADASCSIMNIIVNNSESRRKYTWKLKEWCHRTEYFCARTAGYSKSEITEETKSMTLSGLAARDTTPEQIVESVVRSLRQQKASDKLKLSSLLCGNNFEPYMDDSLINLQNAIGFNPDNMKKPTRPETLCPLVDLTSGSEEITPIPRLKAKLGKSPSGVVARPPKDLKEVIKSRVSGLAEPPPKKLRINRSEEGAQIVQAGSTTQILSLPEMMIVEENRGELELDLSNNIPGNALLVAEARFRKLINMNIIGVLGINKAGRCIIGTVDSNEVLQVMHQIQNMIRDNTLDVGPNMREIFFPPPFNRIRPRFVMIRCNSHCKWEIVGVVQKKGPARARNKGYEFKTKATSTTKPQVPQVIDLEEEERQKQLAGQSCDIKQKDHFDIIEPPSPDEKDSGAWEGSLPMIASVHSASDSNMAELIGSPETTQEEPEKPHLAEESPIRKIKTPPSTQKALPGLVPISSTSLPMPSLVDQEEGLLLETQGTSSEASSQKVYFVPTALSVPSSALTTASSVSTDTPLKSVTLNLASNKAFGDSMEKPPLPSRSFSGGKKVSYVLPKLPGSGKNYTSTLSSTHKASKNTAEGHDTDTGQAVETPTLPSSKMLHIPVTSSCVSKVLFVPSVSSGSSQRMMLLPTLSDTGPLDTSFTSSGSSSTPSAVSTATITISKMKMVLVPSPQDANKMLLIPATPDGNIGAGGTSSIGNAVAEGEKKKMLVLPPYVINNLVSRSASSDTSTESYQQSCTVSLLVPTNTGVLPTKHKLNELGKDSQTQQECSSSQENPDDDVIGPTTNNLPITGTMTSSESMAVKEETPTVLISPAPIATSSGVAETYVVSSLATISSTVPEKASYTKISSNSEVTSQDKQHVSTDALNTLLTKTHEEMVTETKPVEEGLTVESVNDMDCGKAEKGPPVTKVLIRSQNFDIKREDTLDQQKMQTLIKKSGFHWSAVDLSINFKSVKLEWLLGTIRKNVLMNVYRISKRTHSPVTMSVKNDRATSMLYGFARYCSTSTLPILILGSVVSAVLSSSSVPDSMLFQIDSVKYFIRENTGELSSYTYSSETHLVKLASKKRGNGGEMVGVGEQVEIYKIRDPAYQSNIEKVETEARKASGSFSSLGRSCSCTEAGHLTCKRCCASEFSLEWGGVEDTSQDSSKYRSSRVLSDESQYASLGLQDTSLAHICPKGECGFPGRSRLLALKKLHSENESQILNKPKTMSKMTERKVGKKTAKAECYTQVHKVEYDQQSLEKGKSIVPKVKCEAEDEGSDIDVVGDFDASPTILSDLQQQLEDESNAVQKQVSSFASSGKSVKRKGMKVQPDGPPLKKMRTGLSPSAMEQPCPRSRKPSVLGKIKKAGLSDAMTSGTEERQGKDTVDPSSRYPMHLAHLRPYVTGDIPVASEDENSDACILSRDKMSLLNTKQPMMYAAINRSRQVEERNTEVHNKLERMRRRVMRQLFMHLQRIIVKIPRNPLMTHTQTHAKKTVLCAGQRVCEILKTEEIRLMMEEDRVRSERSALIKHLAGIIGDPTEEIKLKWRKWVRENLQKPTAKQTFEKSWQPFCLEKDILKHALEDNFDMDFDEGSPLPERSPSLASLSSLSSGDDKITAQKSKRPPQLGMTSQSVCRV